MELRQSGAYYEYFHVETPNYIKGSNLENGFDL